MDNNNDIVSNSNESNEKMDCGTLGAQLKAFLERREVPDGPMNAETMETLRREQQDWDAKFPDLTVYGKAFGHGATHGTKRQLTTSTSASEDEHHSPVTMEYIEDPEVDMSQYEIVENNRELVQNE